jgi:ABC-type phosphate/phosphonate transport system substrate-binding protein
MYDLPELGWAHDTLSAAFLVRIRNDRNFAAARLPELRERPGELLAFWRDPMLLLSQSCGYPLVTTMRGRLRVVATPCYAAEGCTGALVRSAVVVRTGDPAETLADLRGRATCAINGHDSNSGMNLLRAAVAPLAAGGRFFRDVLVTGTHVASIRAVADGAADVAGIDCVTWALLARARPSAVAGLRVLDWTTATPGLPLVTSSAMPDAAVASLRAALDAVVLDPALQPAREALLIEKFERLDEKIYDRVTEIEQQAVRLSYPVLK